MTASVFAVNAVNSAFVDIVVARSIANISELVFLILKTDPLRVIPDVDTSVSGFDTII
jgi:hypothetical protein